MVEEFRYQLDSRVSGRLRDKYSHNRGFIDLFEWLYDELKSRVPEVSCKARKRYVGLYPSPKEAKVMAYIDFQQDYILIGVVEDVFDRVGPKRFKKQHFPDWNKRGNLVGVKLVDRESEIIDLLVASYFDRKRGSSSLMESRSSCSGSSQRRIDVSTEEDDRAFPEGEVRYRLHRRKERSASVVRLAKRIRLRIDPWMRCDICGFSFREAYGSVGTGFIEAHHTLPLSELDEETQTTVEDIALVCSNCHRMLHRKRPWIGFEELKELLKG